LYFQSTFVFITSDKKFVSVEKMNGSWEGKKVTIKKSDLKSRKVMNRDRYRDNQGQNQK